MTGGFEWNRGGTVERDGGKSPAIPPRFLRSSAKLWPLSIWTGMFRGGRVLSRAVPALSRNVPRWSRKDSGHGSVVGRDSSVGTEASSRKFHSKNLSSGGWIGRRARWQRPLIAACLQFSALVASRSCFVFFAGGLPDSARRGEKRGERTR
jgi:hypothetical protein